MIDALMQRMDDDAPLEPAGRRLDLIGECIRRGSVSMQEARSRPSAGRRPSKISGWR
jgi:hypothetical protein